MGILKRLDETIIIEDDSKNEKELVEYCLQNDISLNEANLQNLDLSTINFDNAFLEGISFKNANLSEMTSKNACFANCDFSGVDLYACNFLYTDLQACKFENANLRDCIGDMKNIFTIALDTYIMTFTKTHMNLGCQAKSLQEWREYLGDDMDEEHKQIWRYYKGVIFQIINKRLGVENG